MFAGSRDPADPLPAGGLYGRRAGAHEDESQRGQAPGLCKDLRLPAERGRRGEDQGFAGGNGLLLYRRSRGGGLDPLQHLRRPGARGGPGVRQRGGLKAHQKAPPLGGHRRVRLHDRAGAGGPAPEKELPLCGPGLRHPCDPPPAGDALHLPFPGEAGVPPRGGRGRGAGRPAGAPGRHFPGLGDGDGGLR